MQKENRKKRSRSLYVTKKTRRNSQHIKVVKFRINNHPYFCPAFDHEDIALEKIGDHTRLESESVKNKPFKSVIKKSQKMGNRDKSQYLVKVIGFILKKFFTRVLEDVIRNDVVFMFPRNYVYIVAAQQSPDSKTFKYDPVTGQARVMIMLVFSRRGYAICKGRKKFISVTPRFEKMIKEEIEKGHVYPGIDAIIKKMQSYGY